MRSEVQKISGLITEVFPGPLTGTPPAGDPSYSAIGFFDLVSQQRCSVALTNTKPRRAQIGVDVIPAAVHTPCEIVVFRDENGALVQWLFVHEEVPIDEACTT
jgi:hypothetical protein